jgi:hypothetical protein
MISKLVILLLLFVGLVAAIRFLHKHIPRVVSILVIVVAAIGCASLAYFAIAMSSVQCLGSCG